MLVVDLSRRVRWRLAAAVVLTAVLAWSIGQEPAVAEALPAALPVARGRERPIYRIGTNEPKVALTFDISWGTRMPGPVLDQLDRYGVKATFFLSGPWSERHPEIVRRIAGSGHEVQSHGHKHVNFSTLSAEGVVENLRAAHDILTRLTGQTPSFVRPPNGDFDDKSILAARSIGYETVIWDVDSLDWMNPGVDRIVERVLRLTKPGSIILMHASDSCKQTDQALPRIIEGLRGRGLQIVTLRELLRLGPPVIPTLAPLDGLPPREAPPLRG